MAAQPALACVSVPEKLASRRATNFPALSAVAAVVAALILFAGLGTRAAAQSSHNNLPVETPESTHEHEGDRGQRAHTSHFILFRPERSNQVVTHIPVGETPGSLACVYQT